MSFLLLLGLTAFIYNTFAWIPTNCGPTNQITKWGEIVDPNNVLPEYPRPQMVRGNDRTWINLNGLWDFNGTTNENIKQPLGYTSGPFATQILVPFAAESCLSGVGKTYKHLQYKRIFNDFTNRYKSTTKVLLQFGAIDWQSQIYLNGKLLGSHTGGYDSFTIDITDHIQSTNNELMVSVYDPSDDGNQPNGKQRISAIINPGNNTYTPSSGIWQTVWMELVNDPKIYISAYKLYPTLSSVTVNVSISGGNLSAPLTLTVIDPTNNSLVTTVKGVGNTNINITIPNPKLWDPLNNSPFLYDLNISLDNSLEHVLGYFGLRTIKLGQYTHHSEPGKGPNVGQDRSGGDLTGQPIKLNPGDPYTVCLDKCNADKNKGCAAWAYGVPNCGQSQIPQCWLKSTITGINNNKCRISGTESVAGGAAVQPLLNGKPLFLAGWLDPSFWPDGIYTAPTDDALKFDLQSILDIGLNGVRLHQKVNSERWYYWADKLGIIIMQDMVQKYNATSNKTVEPFINDLTSLINGKFNHPSIIQWNIFNEDDYWNVFPSINKVVSYVKALDSTRLIDDDSGGDTNHQHIGAVNDFHEYPYPGDPQPYEDYQYAILGEYGGIGCFISGKEWVKNGCSSQSTKVYNPSDFASIYVNMSKMILEGSGDISSVIYSQLSDIEEECDGFFNYDRTQKWNIQQTKLVIDANQNMINNMWN